MLIRTRTPSLIRPLMVVIGTSMSMIWLRPGTRSNRSTSCISPKSTPYAYNNHLIVEVGL